MSRQRVTIKNLEALCDTLNRITGSPLKPYAPNAEGKLKSQVGNYNISQCYGGFSLHRMANESGGVSDVLSIGHVPARQLFDAMHAYMRGIYQGEEIQKAKV